MIHCQSLSVDSHIGFMPRKTPALLHTRLTLPYWRSVSCASASTDSACETSVRTPMTSSSARRSSVTAASSAFSLDVGQHDLHAFAAEALGHGAADAAGAAGDYGDLAFEVSHRITPSLLCRRERPTAARPRRCRTCSAMRPEAMVSRQLGHLRSVGSGGGSLRLRAISTFIGLIIDEEDHRGDGGEVDQLVDEIAVLEDAAVDLKRQSAEVRLAEDRGDQRRHEVLDDGGDDGREREADDDGDAPTRPGCRETGTS